MYRRKRRVIDKGTYAIGIDPSLVGTALAVVNYDRELRFVRGWCNEKGKQKKHSDYLNYYKIADNRDSSKVHRVKIMSQWVIDIVSDIADKANPYVAIEGYAFSKLSMGMSDIHELVGIIKAKLLELKVPMRIYPPTVLKKAWTGAGNADKSGMLLACYKEFGLDFTSIPKFGDNLADAVLIAQLLAIELRVRDGVDQLNELNPSIREALLNTTKNEPEAIISRPFIINGSNTQHICEDSELIGRIMRPKRNGSDNG